MKMSIATIYTQSASQDGIKEITSFLENAGYEIVWDRYPTNAIIVKENGESE